MAPTSYFTDEELGRCAAPSQEAVTDLTFCLARFLQKPREIGTGGEESGVISYMKETKDAENNEEEALVRALGLSLKSILLHPEQAL